MSELRIFVVFCLLLSGCGGESESSPGPLIGDDEEAPPTAIADGGEQVEDDPITETTIRLSDHLGSLYQAFDWSGPIRDPMRDELEIQNAATFVAMTEAEKQTLSQLSSERDIIAQIGGMGSAKLAPDATQASDQFSDYMDSIIADHGTQWRAAVRERATEVIASLGEESQFFWQVGNEVNASSYTRNAVYYFDGDTNGLSDSEFAMQTYVEYFLAPTVQAFQEAENATGDRVNVALGSVSAFSAPSSQAFLDDLLTYEIEGTYAPDLAGKQVHEIIDLITIHYLAHAYDANTPDHWKSTLEGLYDRWVHSNILGVWTTEEVGINLASGGLGAGAALAIAGRYLEWIADRQLSPQQSRWFYYGTQAGNEDHRISDAMASLYSLTGGRDIIYQGTLTPDDTTEVRSFAITTDSGAEVFVLASVFSENSQTLTHLELPQDIQDQFAHREVVGATLYARDLTTPIGVTVSNNSDELLLNLSDIQVARLETVLIHLR
ncbi:hypothetical protein [uncultured Thalassolituus sp.]|uniref:hypothetical protein n=1 Tax=uncultured Thalassolituus sp. TaxID=285273 RepID=UPI00260F937C|nr:hypothetical protein [uncultured Thalassolituus sp.]